VADDPEHDDQEFLALNGESLMSTMVKLAKAAMLRGTTKDLQLAASMYSKIADMTRPKPKPVETGKGKADTWGDLFRLAGRAAGGHGVTVTQTVQVTPASELDLDLAEPEPDGT
jgi:hypothetical protein